MEGSTPEPAEAGGSRATGASAVGDGDRRTTRKSRRASSTTLAGTLCCALTLAAGLSVAHAQTRSTGTAERYIGLEDASEGWHSFEIRRATIGHGKRSGLPYFKVELAIEGHKSVTDFISWPHDSRPEGTNEFLGEVLNAFLERIDYDLDGEGFPQNAAETRKFVGRTGRVYLQEKEDKRFGPVEPDWRRIHPNAATGTRPSNEAASERTETIKPQRAPTQATPQTAIEAERARARLQAAQEETPKSEETEPTSSPEEQAAWTMGALVLAGAGIYAVRIGARHRRRVADRKVPPNAIVLAEPSNALASVLLAWLHPKHAQSAYIHTGKLQLDYPKGRAQVALKDVSKVSTRRTRGTQLVVIRGESAPRSIAVFGRKQATEAAKTILREAEYERDREFLGRLQEKPLNEEQKRAVTTDAQSQLIIASAGSGKTAVITAKAAWLAYKAKEKPGQGYPSADRILLLAYTKAAQREMEERVKRIFREHVDEESADLVQARTLHSLGKEIMEQAEGGEKLGLHDSAKDESEERRNGKLVAFMKEIVAELAREGAITQALFSWYEGHYVPYKPEDEFETQGEYWEYLKTLDLRAFKPIGKDERKRTARREVVKSFEELLIANYLFFNGVEYEYEASYEYDTATTKKSQYKPDFFIPLPEDETAQADESGKKPRRGIYLEHFGVDEHGNTAPWIDGEDYRRRMDWKRRLHAEKGTTLIETYSWQHRQGKLAQALDEQLRENGIEPKSLTPDELFEALEDNGEGNALADLLATFFNHFKSAELSFNDIRKRAADAAHDDSERFVKRVDSFLALFEPAYERYERKLHEAGEIDFHDMIREARAHVERKRWESRFDFILVDEFQDISAGKARMLKALVDQRAQLRDDKRPARLCAVGDDWQSIYRFTGAEVAIMQEFERWFGPTERTFLERTFRLPRCTAENARKFVTSNEAQIKKTVYAENEGDPQCVQIALGTERFTDEMKQTASKEKKDPLKIESALMIEETLEKIREHAKQHEGRASVLVLGRYKDHYLLESGALKGIRSRFKDLDVEYSTIHGAKGRESDYAIVIDVTNARMGFPNTKNDDAILELALPAREDAELAEERRLFYVALTRAKRHVFVHAQQYFESSFVQELMNGEYEVRVHGKDRENEVSCPLCETGRLTPQYSSRDHKWFYECSNRPYCKYTRPLCDRCGPEIPIKTDDGFECPKCKEQYLACSDPECTGTMMPFTHGGKRFLRCTRYNEVPGCDETLRKCPACEHGVHVRIEQGVVHCKDCGERLIACPRNGCDGWMVARDGRNGAFLSCTRWPKTKCPSKLNWEFCELCEDEKHCLREQRCALEKSVWS